MTEQLPQQPASSSDAHNPTDTGDSKTKVLTDGHKHFRHHSRKSTLPFSRSTRQKPRRWPLALRFIKGAIHGAIVLPVVLHALVAAAIVFMDKSMDGQLRLPSSIIPSLSIVVGLMLVFRNQTSYDRFWTGRNLLTNMMTSVRNLTRSFLVCSSLYSRSMDSVHEQVQDLPPMASIRETDAMVRTLLAILYATKHHLRASWGATTLISDVAVSVDPSCRKGTGGGSQIRSYEREINMAEYSDLLPPNFRGILAPEDFTGGEGGGGVGLPLQLTYPIEAYIKRYADTGAFNAPQASQLTVQLNTLVSAYGTMETIRLTGIPVAILIHQKQVLALFGCVLPFALVEGMGWWAVPIVAIVCFALYGIDGIARQLEDPFGFDRNDIKVDGLVEDVREEVMGLLEEWRRVVGWKADAHGTTTDDIHGVESGRTGDIGKRQMFVALPQDRKAATAADADGLGARFRD